MRALCYEPVPNRKQPKVAMPTIAHPAVQQALTLASQALQRGDTATAERALVSLHAIGLGAHPDALNMLGTVRLNQRRFTEAEGLFKAVRAAAPRDAMAAYHLGEALNGQGRVDDAVEAYRAAIRLKPDFVEAHFNLARLLHGAGRLDEAEKHFRDVLRLVPTLTLAKFALGVVLLDAGKAQEAETALRRALDETGDIGLKTQIQLKRALALRMQHRHDEALECADAALALDPRSSEAAMQRAGVLQGMNRQAEALAILQGLLARAPGDPGLHHAVNDLLYRMGQEDEFLKSYDRAPPSRPLVLGKAFFLSHAGRDAECHAIYSAMAARDPDDRLALLGAAKALARLNRAPEAAAIYDAMLARTQDDVGLYGLASEAALLQGDATKAAWLCEQGLAREPRHAVCLSHLGLALRMQDDPRDEVLNGYDSLVQVFDLDAPDGFAAMADFNAALNAELGALHPANREYIDQSLRGGTQTADNLFGSGRELVDKLQMRIDAVVSRYIAGLPEDAAHPFLSRRARDFRYAGSWSSRLSDHGYHVNHIHPMGWISSCYYVAVPDVVQDSTQGWIKFGEPSLAMPLKTPVRRSIQPVPGRLVLFPSYMWHGTVPFHDAAARTTVAFDVVPA